MAATVGASEAMQRRANDSVWLGNQVAAYATRILRPVEVVILARYRDELGGRVLELGCGAGRLTGFLAEIATQVYGIDLSEQMVAYCRARYPSITFAVGDLRDVGLLEPGSRDAVVAGFNILDVLDDDDRASVLDGIHSTLVPGGMLVMSSHNRAVADRLGDALRLRGQRPREVLANLLRQPRWRRNRRRLIAFERDAPTYAIRNDVGHGYAVLHYYTTRDAQQAQLEAHGFELLACLDLEGRAIEAGDPASTSSELHYVARRLG
jgi:SAM-dependent methyltransferase